MFLSTISFEFKKKKSKKYGSMNEHEKTSENKLVIAKTQNMGHTHIKCMENDLRGVEWVHDLFLFPLVLGKM